MKTIETTVYSFDELSDEAKEKAREWFISEDPFAWGDEWLDSIKTFCNHFNVKLKSWNVGPWSCVDYTTDADNSSFRGLKLRSVNPDHMPTGFYGDYSLWNTFHVEFKRTGDAKAAFDAAMYKGFKDWCNDWEHAYSDEAVDETMKANDYQFTVDGHRSMTL